MALISHQYRCVFIHVPRCAGTSITSVLQSHGFTATAKVHSGALGLRAQWGVANFEKYLTFAVVRNPWDRLVAFHCWRHGGFDAKAFRRELRERHRKRYRTQLAFITDGPSGNCFPDYPASARIIVKQVLRYERLHEGFAALSASIFGDPAPLPHLNRSHRRADYRGYYTEETRRLASERCAREAAVLGYSFDGS